MDKKKVGRPPKEDQEKRVPMSVSVAQSTKAYYNSHDKDLAGRDLDKLVKRKKDK